MLVHHPTSDIIILLQQNLAKFSMTTILIITNNMAVKNNFTQDNLQQCAGIQFKC